MNETIEFVNVERIAEVLNVPKSWIYQRTRLGQTFIPHIKMGKYLRFDVAEVVAFFKKNNELPGNSFEEAA